MLNYHKCNWLSYIRLDPVVLRDNLSIALPYSVVFIIVTFLTIVKYKTIFYH